MKYLLPLTLIASAAWAATRDSAPHASVSAELAAVAETSRVGDPPWLTGALDADEIAAAEGDDPHAALFLAGDDPHAGSFADLEPMGMCPRDTDDAAGLEEGGELDPHQSLREIAPGVAVPRVPLARSVAVNGHSIAELHAQRAALAEQQVRVRGTVVKRTDGILGETYLHLRDGTGSAEAHDDDLTVTTSEEFALGETVEIEGRLVVDQDLGLGYSYRALLASAVRVSQR